jgi:uncharacterized protein
MSNDVIFKTFRTYKHPYVYDRHTNSLVMLTEDEYRELSQVEKGELPAAQSPVIRKYQESGMFKPNVVEKIEHPGTNVIEQHLKTRMKQLILQVTQQCNLRCEYCVYSGIYDRNRTHSNQRMTFETAKKAIDFFLERSWELTEINISFYGGEPLLEFDLIKQCVEYTKSQTEGKRIRFNITTNGTLLSDSTVDYLVENNFYLSISLDGSQEEHDVNRKFINGDGSFDTIIENIKRTKKRYPEFDNNILILTTINPHMDLDCVLEFFSTGEIFNDKKIMFNTVNKTNLKGMLTYDEKFYRIRNFEYIKMLFSIIGKLEVKYVSPLVISSRAAAQRKHKDIHKHSEMMSITHHSGPCKPGVQRLFVRVDGTLFPCERVSETLDYFKIGTLENGFDINRMKDILNIGKTTETECKKCWNLRHCTLCAGQVEFDTQPSREAKIKECPQSDARALFELYELCVLNEFGLDAEEMSVR